MLLYFNLIFGYKLVILTYFFFEHAEIKITYHGLSPVTICITIYNTILLWMFYFTTFISYYFQHITRSVTECPPIQYIVI